MVMTRPVVALLPRCHTQTFGVPVVIEPTTLSNHLLEALCPIHFTIVLQLVD